MPTEVDVIRAIASLDALADELARAVAPPGLPWWGPAADAWRRDVRSDARALRDVAADLRRLDLRRPGGDAEAR